MLQCGAQTLALQRGADRSLGLAAQTLVCTNEPMVQAVFFLPAERSVICTGRDWWYPSTRWKGNLLVNLQIEVEVVDKEVDGDELSTKQATSH